MDSGAVFKVRHFIYVTPFVVVVDERTQKNAITRAQNVDHAEDASEVARRSGRLRPNKRCSSHPSCCSSVMSYAFLG